jgi:hypothetical protein
MATIDKNSITVTKTNDNSVFKVDFDFTDSTTLDINQGWLVPWLHASFMSGIEVSPPEFNEAGLAAMAYARRSTIESGFESYLRSNYGASVIRSQNPTSQIYQKIQIMAVSSTVIFNTVVAT